MTGVSGSGKSTLINDTLHRIAARELYSSAAQPADFESVENLGLFDKVVELARFHDVDKGGDAR